jgi:type IV pilus assembly protein PilB
MVDVPLGTLIFRAGLLGEEQLEDALREGMRTGRRLGEVLIERGLLQERDLGRLLAGQKGLPFVEVTAPCPCATRTASSSSPSPTRPTS